MRRHLAVLALVVSSACLGIRTHQDPQAALAGDAPRVYLDLVVDGDLRGILVDANGHPMADVQVMVTHGDLWSPGWRTTDDDGAFEYRGLSADTYTLTVSDGDPYDDYVVRLEGPSRRIQLPAANASPLVLVVDRKIDPEELRPRYERERDAAGFVLVRYLGLRRTVIAHHPRPMFNICVDDGQVYATEDGPEADPLAVFGVADDRLVQVTTAPGGMGIIVQEGFLCGDGWLAWHAFDPHSRGTIVAAPGRGGPARVIYRGRPGFRRELIAIRDGYVFHREFDPEGAIVKTPVTGGPTVLASEKEVQAIMGPDAPSSDR
jgi:hypothetical protein